MIAAFDVHYVNDTASTACVCFENWTDSVSTQDFVEEKHNIAPYESGQFYKRELPCIVSLLENNNLQPDIIVIDGYVWLDENRKGLGAHLFENLDRKIPIIGVAKTKFQVHPKLREVFRGNSQTPLFVTAVGSDVDEAADLIKQMHGNFRLPTLLKRADMICRGTITL
ncbi:MAG TPA: endonuclease V [Pyrinomonadaceae bacterium]|nr:endonuclease V [Pyrinomonadaceae bacterium]